MPTSHASSQVHSSTASARRPGTVGHSRRLLAELLALNEEMIRELAVERREDADTAAFLTTMIGQHERTAALLRREMAEIKKPGKRP